jgi:serine/threonine protein kinase
MDQYLILEVVGEGSFGRVFKAKHKQTGAIVALKLIRKVSWLFNLLRIGHVKKCSVPWFL